MPPIWCLFTIWVSLIILLEVCWLGIIKVKFTFVVWVLFLAEAVECHLVFLASEHNGVQFLRDAEVARSLIDMEDLRS